MMENTSEPNEEILKIFDDMDDITFEAPRRKPKRSSILKRPKSTEDDNLAEDVQNGRKSVGSKRRVSFAEKFQVMEMTTGNIYDISGKSNSTLNKDSNQNEAVYASSIADTTSIENYAENDVSKKNICMASSTEISVTENGEPSLSSLPRKHKIDSDCDLEPERKKVTAQFFPFHLDPDSVCAHPNDELSEFKNLFNTDSHFTMHEKRDLGMELLLNKNSILNSDSSQFGMQERHIRDGSKFVESNSSLLKLDNIIQGPDRSSNVNIFPISLSNMPLVENKENIYVDVKNKSILVTNARQLKLKDNTLQISQDLKIPSLESQISNERNPFRSSKTSSLDSENYITGTTKGLTLSTKADKSDSDKTCLFNNAMDLTCVEDLNDKEDFKTGERLTYCNASENLFHNDTLNKTVFDTSQNMEMTCRLQDMTVMQDSQDSIVENVSETVHNDMSIRTTFDISENMDMTCNPDITVTDDSQSSIVHASETAKLTSQQNEDTSSKSSFGNLFHNGMPDRTTFVSRSMDMTCHPIPDSKDTESKRSFVNLFFSDMPERTMFDISHNMDMTCHPISDSQDSILDGVSETAKLTSEQNADATAKSAFGNQLKNDKTVFDTSHYMDMTCTFENVTVMKDSPESSLNNVCVSDPSVLTCKQNEDIISKVSYRNLFKSDKSVFAKENDILNCKENVANDIECEKDSILEVVSETAKLTSEQNENATAKSAFGTELKNDKTVFDTSHYMDMTCNFENVTVMKDSPESSLNNVCVSDPSVLTCKQNEDIASKVSYRNLFKSDKSVFAKENDILNCKENVANDIECEKDSILEVCSETAKLTSEQNEDATAKSAFGTQLKNDKTVFDTSHYMDMTCNFENVTVMKDSPESSLNNVCVSDASVLTCKQDEDIASKVSYRNQFKSDKSVFAKENNILDCKENVANDIECEGDKCTNSSGPNIVYAIKQLKDMRHSAYSCDSKLKFPEVFLSVRKPLIPRKSSFSCSSVQLSKVVRDSLRQSSRFTNREFSFISKSNHDSLSDDKYNAVSKVDKSLSKDFEDPPNSASELPAQCDISSNFQVLRSVSKTIEKKIITHCFSPRQISSTGKTDVPQIFKESSALNQSIDDLNSIRKSLNFENEATGNLTRTVISSDAKKISSEAAKNCSIFLDNSELCLENCSIDLVPNDDSVDSNIIKCDSAITLADLKSSKSIIPCQGLTEESLARVAMKKEGFLPNVQNEVEKVNIERSTNDFLSNLDMINVDKQKSIRLLRDEAQEKVNNSFFANSSRLSISQNGDSHQNSSSVLENQSKLKNTFVNEVVCDKNIKFKMTKEKLSTETQKNSRTLNITKSETDEGSCKSTFPGEKHKYESGKDAVAGVGVNKGLTKSQGTIENTHESPKKIKSSTNYSHLENLSRSSVKHDELYENSTTAEKNKIKKPFMTKMLDERNIISNNNTHTENCEIDAEKVSKATIDEGFSSAFEKGRELKIDTYKTCATMSNPCTSEQSKVREVTKKDDNCSSTHKFENSAITALPITSVKTAKRKSSDEDDVFLQENDQYELKQILRMEVDENPGLDIVNGNEVDKELILNTSELSRTRTEKRCQDSFAEKQNCVIQETHVTEITVIEKHVVTNSKLENEMCTPRSSKLLKTEYRDEICSKLVTLKQNPNLLQENTAKSTKASVSKLNEKLEDNADAALDKKENQSKLNESSVVGTFRLLSSNEYHQPAGMVHADCITEKNNLLKGFEKNVPNKNAESCSVSSVLPNAPQLSQSENIIEQYKHDYQHEQKQYCCSASNEVTENDQLHKTHTNEEILACPSDLSISQVKGKSALVMNNRNLGVIEECRQECRPKMTKTAKNSICSSSPHNSLHIEEKTDLPGEHTQIQDINMEDCPLVLDSVERTNSDCEVDYEKIHTLRKKLTEESYKDDSQWRLKEMDDKQAVCHILPGSVWSFYIMYVSLELDDDISSSAKISFKHWKPELDARDEMGFLLFKSYMTPEITLSPFSVDKLLDTISKSVEYALVAKSLIRDLWLVAVHNRISIDNSQSNPKLTIKVLNKNHSSLFSLTFAINLKSYPRERMIPKIQHIDLNIINSESVLNALKEVQPGRNYLSNMAKAANAL